MTEPAFQALLKLQEIDASIDRLEYRRSHGPLHESLEQVRVRAGSLRPSLTDATSRRDALETKRDRIDLEVQSTQRRITEITDRLYGATPVAPKDAQSMSEEVDHLKERLSSLEDDELGVMVDMEPAESEVQRLESDARGLAEQLAKATQAVEVEQAEVDDELERVRSGRDSAASDVPETLRGEYARLRLKLGGIAVAEVKNGSCDGCHLTLSASEVAKVQKAKPEELIHCEECGRILIH